MGIICGKCDNIISDIGTCNEATMFPEPDKIDETYGKNIQVFECSQCGSLNLFWYTWPDGEEQSLVYAPTNNHYNEITLIRNDEFFQESKS